MELTTPDQILESKDRRIEVRITQRELDQIDRVIATNRQALQTIVTHLQSITPFPL
jgi:hypothetical protein